MLVLAPSQSHDCGHPGEGFCFNLLSANTGYFQGSKIILIPVLQNIGLARQALLEGLREQALTGDAVTLRHRFATARLLSVTASPKPTHLQGKWSAAARGTCVDQLAVAEFRERAADFAKTPVDTAYLPLQWLVYGAS